MKRKDLSVCVELATKLGIELATFGNAGVMLQSEIELARFDNKETNKHRTG